jgi:hypothetical protein
MAASFAASVVVSFPSSTQYLSHIYLDPSSGNWKNFELRKKEPRIRGPGRARQLNRRKQHTPRKHPVSTRNCFKQGIEKGLSETESAPEAALEDAVSREKYEKEIAVLEGKFKDLPLGSPLAEAILLRIQKLDSIEERRLLSGKLGTRASFSRKETARLFGVTVRTISTWLREGRLNRTSKRRVLNDTLLKTLQRTRHLDEIAEVDSIKALYGFD